MEKSRLRKQMARIWILICRSIMYDPDTEGIRIIHSCSVWPRQPELTSQYNWVMIMRIHKYFSSLPHLGSQCESQKPHYANCTNQAVWLSILLGNFIRKSFRLEITLSLGQHHFEVHQWPCLLDSIDRNRISQLHILHSELSISIFTTRMWLWTSTWSLMECSGILTSWALKSCFILT